MRQITFEMAQDLGLIPQVRDRYLTTQFPFESYQAFKDRGERGELGYRSDLDRLKRDYKYVYFHGEKLEVI